MRKEEGKGISFSQSLWFYRRFACPSAAQTTRKFFRSCSETFFASRIAKFAVVANSSYAVQLIMCVFLHQSPFYALPEKQVPKVEITDPALFSAIFCRFFRGPDTLRGRS